MLMLWAAALGALTLIHYSDAALSEIEQQFVDVPGGMSARESLHYITSRPHVAGTPGDWHMARYVRDRLVEAGIPSVDIHAPEVQLAYPVDRSLTLFDADTGAAVFKAPLSESVRDMDPTSDTWWRNHTFNGYSPSGDVTARLVYANFGTPDDFDALEASGVDVNGAIVIARYGRCFRGLKAMNAQQRGAFGLVIYSDPAQDGYKDSNHSRKVMPDGPWRPSDAVQRGSVQFNSLCAGDPLRAYLGGEASARAICGYPPEDLVPAIPVLPISYGDATPLLRALGGPEAPDEFRGALPLTYRTGPSTGKVRLAINNRKVVGPIWNVIGVIPGVEADPPAAVGGGGDRPVVLGNHRDAWVYGAVDPNSGTAAMIEVARGLGALLATGWRPRRSIVLCSWSGEEFGLLGSTAWGEVNSAGLLKRAIAYLNVDSAVSGSQLAVKATPSLTALLRAALEDLPDPKRMAAAASAAAAAAAAPPTMAAAAAQAAADLKTSLSDAWSGNVGMLGSGSDYTVFLDALGIASIDFEFVADLSDDYGVYHSVYDSFAWMDKWGDPTWEYHAMAARLWGLMALRLADAAVLPFDHLDQAAAIERYVADVGRRPGRSPAGEAAAAAVAVAGVDLRPLREAATRFRAAAEGKLPGGAFVVTDAAASGAAAMAAAAAAAVAAATAELNDRLAFVERRFL
ncbi:unnamed protein product, partial [Phaeothamnion confervicola]